RAYEQSRSAVGRIISGIGDAMAKGNRTGKKGGQLNNDLARKSGVFKRRYKRSSREGVAIQFVQDEIAAARGGYETLSPQEQLIIQRIAVTTVRISLMEAEMIIALRKKELIPEWRDKCYLAWKSSLRADLQLIGMERRAKDLNEIAMDEIQRRYTY